jgi:hypothetical protein
MSQKATILVKKSARLARQLNEVLEELALMTEESPIQTPHTTKLDFDADELRAEFEKLRLAVEQGSEAQDVIEEFMSGMSKGRLNAFIRANGLPILSKDSNISVTTQLVQLLRQSKAIGASVKSLSRSPSDN